MTLQDILSDSKTFTDEMEMQLGEHKVKLADLRGLTAKQQKDLSEKLQAASQREQNALDTSNKAADLLAKLQAAEAEAEKTRGKQPTGDEDDFDTNNWWTPVRKRMSASEAKVQEAITKFDNLSKTVERAATIFATDRWNAQFERTAPRLKKVKEYEDWDMPKVREYATKNQLVDEFGFPSIERAVKELTKVSDLEEAKKQAREEGFREGQQRARLAGQNRPSSASGGRNKSGKSSVEEFGLEGLGDDIASDPELMEQLELARQAFDANTLQ